MVCRIEDLRDKEVISMTDGTRVGYVCDAEMNTQTAALTALVVYGKPRLFGLLGREEDFVIAWDSIALIGDDTILVHFQPPRRKKKKSGVLASFFEIK